MLNLLLLLHEKIYYHLEQPATCKIACSSTVRVTPVSRKAEQKPKIAAAKNLDGNLADSGAQKLNSSVTSIPDQQPAAPKVVLPVLEPSASSTNVAKQVQEAEKTVEEKNGHYFMKVRLTGTKKYAREKRSLLTFLWTVVAVVETGDRQAALVSCVSGSGIG